MAIIFFLTWDYRGLFDSQNEKLIRRLAIANHAEDLHAILQAEKISTIDILVGHSMGVQVSLEFTSLYPEIPQKLVLLNGTYGRVFDSVYQPFFRVPGVHSLNARLIDYLINNPAVLENVCRWIQRWIHYPMHFYDFFLRSPRLEQLLGKGYLYRYIHNYLSDVYSSVPHLRNWLRLFLELDAHSAYHKLRNINQPTLIVSGLLDVLTPAYQSFEMARLLPHNTHIVCVLASHFALLEQPETVLPEIVQLVECQGAEENSSDNNMNNNSERAERLPLFLDESKEQG